MSMDDTRTIVELRAEVERLLAAGMAAQAHHEAELDRQDQRHLAESGRRDQLHVDELERRDGLHADELERRDGLHVDELQRRDDLHAHELGLIRQALDTRDLIGQAKGIIMSTMLCTSDEAFQLLRQQSQHENRKLVDVAAEVVSQVAHRARPASRPRTG